MTLRDVASIVTDWSRDRRTSRKEWALFLLGLAVICVLGPGIIQHLFDLWNINQQWRVDAVVGVVLWVVFTKELIARYRARDIAARWAIGQAVVLAMAIVGAWVGALRALQEMALFDFSTTSHQGGSGWGTVSLVSLAVWAVDGLAILCASFASGTIVRTPRNVDHRRLRSTESPTIP